MKGFTLGRAIDHRYSLPSAAIQWDLGWAPSTPLLDGLDRMIRWGLRDGTE